MNESPDLAPVAATERPYPPAGKAWGVVAIFCLASVVSVIDRGILTLVVDPVRHDLAIGDLQISLLQGLSFGLFYAVMGIPLGLLADRVSRHRLLMAGITIWSLATLLGGFAQGFGGLFVSRLLVGLGEATLAPCAVSMISDMFPAQRRGRPISIYLLGQAIGPGIGIFLTALVIRAVPAGVFASVPVLAGLPPWRVMFILCGLSGIGVVALMLTFREPARRGPQFDAAHGTGFVAMLRYMRGNWTVFVPFYVGFAFVTMHTYGLGAWNATYLIRSFGVSPAQVGKWLGLASMIAGTLGAVAGGMLADRVARRGTPVAKMKLLVGLSALLLPSTLLMFAPSLPAGLALVVWAVAVLPMIGTTMIAAIPELVPGNMRGVAVSLLGLTNTILGSTTGPLFVALATERLYRDPARVGASITTVGIPVVVIGALLYCVALVAMRRRMASPTAFRAVVEAARR